MAPGGMTPGGSRVLEQEGTSPRPSPGLASHLWAGGSAEPSSGAGRHFPTSFPGPRFPPVSRWVRCAREDVGRGAHEVEVCVTTCVPAGPTGSATAGATNPVEQRWPKAGLRGRLEGGQRLARGVSWRGAQPVGVGASLWAWGAVPVPPHLWEVPPQRDGELLSPPQCGKY